jgi:serine/threonine-protein kinase RIO1
VKLDFEVSKDVPQNVRRQHACATDCLQSDIERVQVYRARIHQAGIGLCDDESIDGNGNNFY